MTKISLLNFVFISFFRQMYDFYENNILRSFAELINARIELSRIRTNIFHKVQENG